MSFYITVLTNVGITLIGVLSIFLITGMIGLFSLGQAAFMAIGAYAAGILVKLYAVPFGLAAVIAVLIGAFAGYLVGLPTIRLRRDYIALVTFGFGEAIVAVLNNLSGLTGGAMGLSGIPKNVNFTIVLISVAAVTYLLWNFKRSRYGRQCLALKTDELVAGSMGINVNRLKMIVFVFAAGLTAYAGVLYGAYVTYVDPTLFTWGTSANWLIMVFFGGLNSLTGAIFSGLFLGLLPEFLRNLSQWRTVIYCVIVLITINFRPQGLFGSYELSLKNMPRDVKKQITKVSKKVKK